MLVQHELHLQPLAVRVNTVCDLRRRRVSDRRWHSVPRIGRIERCGNQTVLVVVQHDQDHGEGSDRSDVPAQSRISLVSSWRLLRALHCLPAGTKYSPRSADEARPRLQRLAVEARHLLVALGDRLAARRSRSRPRCARSAGRRSAARPRAGWRRADRCGWSARPWPSPDCAPPRMRAAPLRVAPSFLIWPVRKRASRIAWPAPLEPRGYIGCAASPSRVMRPKLQRGSGSRSTMGYSRISSVLSIMPLMSSQSNLRPAKAGMMSSSRPRPVQSWRTASGRSISATQLISGRPAGLRRARPHRIDHRLADRHPARRDHGVAAEIGRPAHHAAPHVDAGIFGRALVGKELAAQRRMDAVAADRDLAALQAAPSSKWIVTPVASWSTCRQRWPSCTAASPSRWRVASSSTLCRSARWIESCGQS